jgi:hypothetical protein
MPSIPTLRFIFLSYSVRICRFGPAPELGFADRPRSAGFTCCSFWLFSFEPVYWLLKPESTRKLCEVSDPNRHAQQHMLAARPAWCPKPFTRAPPLSVVQAPDSLTVCFKSSEMANELH